MEIIKYSDADDKVGRIINRGRYVDKKIVSTVNRIIACVRKHGDRAVAKYTKKLDHITLDKTNRVIGNDYLSACRDKIDGEIIEILSAARDNITAYHNHQRQESWISEFADNVRLGQVIRPLDRVGVYVPGGRAFYPSTVLMNIIPARIAGVSDIVVATPPAAFLETPLIGATLDLLGVAKVYMAGGAQAIAAMAYGTETIPKVDKIVGPGNIYVATAKQQVFGQVDIDMTAGPSEVVVLAQKGANPEWVALDLLSQAEHRTGYESAVLVTDSFDFAEKVKSAVFSYLAGTEHEKLIKRILSTYGAIIVVKDMAEGARVVNKIAPEHLEIIVENENEIIPLIRHAGAIFVGEYSSEPVGDYWAGPNHVLPTGGTARFFSPLGVYDFFKRSSLIYYSKEALLKHAAKINEFAGREDLMFHGKAVMKRLEDISEKKGG
ncbi:MAG: histidinol dehydrogenase [Spirochaetales bacterium]|nr:histidinol dehydrogenase [Spirochaetales bacterium]